jgi:hypothetical protein
VVVPPRLGVPSRDMAKVVSRVVNLGGAVLVGAVVVTELRKPADERTWRGALGGVVPYDLRPPTLERFRDALWNPENPALLVPHPMGIGWTVNFARLAGLLRRG